ADALAVHEDRPCTAAQVGEEAPPGAQGRRAAAYGLFRQCWCRHGILLWGGKARPAGFFLPADRYIKHIHNVSKFWMCQFGPRGEILSSPSRKEQPRRSGCWASGAIAKRIAPPVSRRGLRLRLIRPTALIRLPPPSRTSEE